MGVTAITFSTGLFVELGRSKMRKKKRDLLKVLKSELEFLESGGYSREISLGPKLIFEDSPTCLNCGRKDNPVIPCTECVLIDLVPLEHRSENIPCRHIPLDASGSTLNSLYPSGNRQEVEKVVGKWLRVMIDRLEKERKARAASHSEM
jgi:hypothetical protein